MSSRESENPVKRLSETIEQGHAQDDADANAAALATSDSVSGRPSVRTVHVHVQDDDIVFFVNSRSGKGQQLHWNPYVALCFFWRYMRKQITVDGQVEVLDDAVADDYWGRRGRGSTLGARASRQHLHEGDRAVLDARLHEEKQSFSFAKVTRPALWIGYRLIPNRLEFWDTGWDRLRSRELFERDVDGNWAYVTQDP